MRYFETILLQEVDEFLETLDDKSKKKVLFNVRVAEQVNDPKLFKKLNDNIWEFRTKFLKKKIRLLAFWDKRGSKKLWFWQLTDLSKKHKRRRKVRLTEQKESGNHIIEIKKQKNENIHISRNGRQTHR